jgi:hypothetical protein
VHDKSLIYRHENSALGLFTKPSLLEGGNLQGKFRQKKKHPENAGQPAVLPALFTKRRSDSFPAK